MTKAELVEEVSKAAELTKKDSEVIVDEVFKNIIQALNRGDKIELRGFGSFRVRKRDARRGRNPKTGEPVDIPALKRLQPTINVASHETRFKDLKTVKYTFGGDPQIEELELELGRAKAIVDLKTENEQKSGKKQKPAEGKATYLLKRIGMGENWEIVEIKYAMSEK